MDRRTRRGLFKTFVGDTRTFVLLLSGLTVYLLLFVSFGGQRVLSRHTRFPRKLWQSWRNDALSFEDRDSERARTWLIKNPTLRHEVLTDGNGAAYVEEVFGPSGFNRPDVVETYKSLNARIIQADLLRYIVMYAEGGIYADVDVEALKAFEDFIPSRFNEEDISMIIGVETDEPDFKSHPVLGSKSTSFCQWVFVCKPRLPVMMRLIDNILIWLNELATKQGKGIADLKLDFDEVLSGTGPSAFTAALLAEMSATTRRSVSWDEFHKMQESKIVGKVLVLPPEAFAAGTFHSHSGNHGGSNALIKHHFHASAWTNAHPRYKHPIFGEVEKCNWDADCVKLWDANTAFFNALPEEDQLKMIAMKDVDDAKAREVKNAGEQPAQIQLGSDTPAEANGVEASAAQDVAGGKSGELSNAGEAIEGTKFEPDAKEEVK